MTTCPSATSTMSCEESSFEGAAESVPGLLQAALALKLPPIVFSSTAARENLVRSEYEKDQTIFWEGEKGSEGFLILEGTCVAVKFKEKGGGMEEVNRYAPGHFFGELSLLHRQPRKVTVRTETKVVVYSLSRDGYEKLLGEQLRRERWLRKVKLLEMLNEEQMSNVAVKLRARIFEAGTKIIEQGAVGTECFIVANGECVAEVATGDSTQEVKRYRNGELFGEMSLLTDAPRAATVTAVSKGRLFSLSRQDLEDAVGTISMLQQEQYLADPRKQLADFYSAGDHRGPGGALEAAGADADTSRPSAWFAVYRPTSHDSIAKMLGRVGVGKGFNIKGKSARKDRLSAFVPYLQISKNGHKAEIQPSLREHRVHVYFQSRASREAALAELVSIMAEPQLRELIERPEIYPLNAYQRVHGLDVPELLLREAYITRPDIEPVLGWETGRPSQPSFMDMNINSVTKPSEPAVVLYQMDKTWPMNPKGLLMAYAEAEVKPVVSDFDTFVVGSKGMSYEELPEDQVKVVMQSLDYTERIASTGSFADWTSQWLQLLNEDKGFTSLKPPKYGFGDPTSSQLIEQVVQVTAATGAVRHGAECFNFAFPQELDSEYLVVWDGFGTMPPWLYKSETELRAFLKDRIKEGYSFPLNPVWPIRDRGWYDILEDLRTHPEASQQLDAWFPRGSGILQRIDVLSMSTRMATQCSI